MIGFAVFALAFAFACNAETPAGQTVVEPKQQQQAVGQVQVEVASAVENVTQVEPSEPLANSSAISPPQQSHQQISVSTSPKPVLIDILQHSSTIKPESVSARLSTQRTTNKPIVAADDAIAEEGPNIEVSTVTRMADEMKQDAVNALREVWLRHGNNFYGLNYLQEITKHLVTTFDEKYGSYWHGSAGENYEAYFTFEKDSFIRMNIGKTHVLLYKHYCYPSTAPDRKTAASKN